MRVAAWLALVLLSIAAPSLAREPRVLQLRFPPLRIPAGTNPEACLALRVPATAPFDVVRFEIRHRGGGRGVAIQHFLVYAYTGDQLAGFPEHGATVTEARGCLAVDLGPPDRDRRQPVASGTAPRSQTTVLPGGALRLAPGGAPAGLGFVLDGEWLNTGSRTRTVSTTVVLRRARGRETSRVATMFSDDSAGAGLLIAPG